jgi:hypothetical protein
MGNEQSNIPNNPGGRMDDQRLMDYLNEQLSKQDSHDLERLMADDPFINDAVEGLSQLDNKKDLSGYVEQLNRSLQKQLDKKKKRREKRQLPNQQWTYLAIFVLLLLCIITYVMVKRQKQKPAEPVPTNISAPSKG